MTEIANVEAARAWAGDDGEHWAAHAELYDASVHRHTGHLFERAAIEPAHAVLDVGCGTGGTTRRAARLAAAGRALGVDLSPQMLERARSEAAAEGLPNVEFELADAQVHPFPPGGFDVVISRFGTMFFEGPVAAFSNLAAALRPGGCLAMLTWRPLADNEWLQTIRRSLAAGRDLPEPPPDGPSPFGLSDPARVEGILGAAGFDDVELAPVDEPIHFPGTADEALAFWTTSGLGRGLLAELDGERRSAATASLLEALRSHETPEGVAMGSASWLVSARRP